MSEKTYQVPVILTIPAENYEVALAAAEEVVQYLEKDSSIGCSVVYDHEHDNQGKRVIYLESEQDQDPDLPQEDM